MLDFDDKGLIPAIVQDAKSGEVLMLGHMSKESLKRTLASGEVWVYSRSRQGLWHEGATSGESLRLKTIAKNCDSDALLIKVESTGPVYRTGDQTCFLQPLEDEDTDAECLANQTAAGMEKQYLYEQLRQQEEEISLVSRLTTIITSSVSIQAIFDGFTQELQKVARIDWATIAVVDENELYVMALSGTAGSSWQAEERMRLEGTATELVCTERKTIYEPDLRRQHRFWTGEHHLQQGVRSILYLPLSITDRDIGSLILGSRKANAYSARQIRLLEKVASQIAAPIENAQLYARAEQRARVDELTGLFNRRHFEERLKEEIERHSEYGQVFSLFMVDLDNFKTHNDIHGHPSGDKLLNQIGRIIESSIRSIGQAFRYGGDEFVTILPHTTTKDAYQVAERLRNHVDSEMKARGSVVTCSIGLAGYPSDGATSDQLVNAADTALYHAKRTGGNRLCLSSAILSEPVAGAEAGIYTRSGGLSAVYALASTVEARDPYTYGHSRKVNTYAVLVAEALALLPHEVAKVSTAALLHDIGKIGIPDRVLNKQAQLSRKDWEVIKSHTRLGASIVGNVPGLVSCLPAILYHHERWDGNGYPEGLKGENIPLEARVLAIADMFASMTSPRSYRDALSDEDALEEIERGAGTQFDPDLVRVFTDVVHAGGDTVEPEHQL